MLPEDRTKAQEEVWATVLDIVESYFDYHQKGPDEPCNNAQKLSVGYILHDLNTARAFGLAAIERSKALAAQEEKPS